jgi:hypothetical protein
MTEFHSSLIRKYIYVKQQEQEQTCTQLSLQQTFISMDNVDMTPISNTDMSANVPDLFLLTHS